MAETNAAVEKVEEKAAATATPDKAGTQSAQSYSFGGKTYGSVDELGKAYESLQSEYGRSTQKYGDLEKQYGETKQHAEQWNKWWEQIKPLWGQDVEDFLKQKLVGSGATPQQAARQTAQAVEQAKQQVAHETGRWDGWELLGPQEQAQRLYSTLADGMNQQFMGQLSQLAKAVNDTIQQKEHWYQSYLNNHLGLLRKALERKFQDPKFDIDKTMEMAAQAIGGQIDPILLGQQLIDAQSFQAQLEEAKKASYAQGKKDIEQEYANKKQESVPPVVGVPRYKMPTGTAGERSANGLASRREAAAQRIYKEFGPQWFAG